MSERSMRSRLTYSGAGSRTYAGLCIGALGRKGYAASGSAALAAGLKQKSVWPALTTSSGNTPTR